MRFSDLYNTVNLIRNGGLDFVKSSGVVPPFWKIEGAEGLASPPVNSFEIVENQVPNVGIGAANYFKVILSSRSEVKIIQEFSDPFIQMGFAEIGGAPWESSDLSSEDLYPIHESMLLRGVEITLSASLRVIKGSVKVSVLPTYKGLTSNPQVIYPALASSSWLRKALPLDLGAKKVKTIEILLQRTGDADVAEVHIGAVSLVLGSATSVPFCGDPMADAIPKGAIVFVVGDVCPPGFEVMSFTPPKTSGRIFPKSAESPSVDVEGDETHDHQESEMTMNPDDDWTFIDTIPTSHGSSFGVRADRGDRSHTHEIDKALHVPPSKDIVLCRRL